MCVHDMEVVLRRYDFSHPHPSDRPADGALDSLHAVFASVFAQALRSVLDSKVEIVAGGTESMRYADFLASRSQPACLSVLRVEPVGVQMCLDVPTHLAYAMINRLRGGGGEAPTMTPSREFTQIERGLALQIIERAAGSLADTWRSSGVASVREEGLSTDPADVRIMPPDEIVSIVTFPTTFNASSGSMTLCLPGPLTDALAGAALSAPASLPTIAQRQRDAQNITQNVMESAVELRALLAETKLRLNEVLELAEGDIITTDVPAADPIPLRLADQTVLHARLGQFNGHRAVEIANPAGGQRSA